MRRLPVGLRVQAVLLGDGLERELEALPRAHQKVWRIRHRLHATRDDGLEFAGSDELISQRYGIKP